MQNEDRFDQLQSFINDLRETFEETRINFASKGADLSTEGNNLEIKLRAQVQALEKEVSDFRRIQIETDEQLKNHLHSVTNNRIEQLIYQNQIELFERVFSVKSHNLHSNTESTTSPVQSAAFHKIKKPVKGPSIGDYMVQLTNNFRLWRNIQVEKGRHEVTELYLNDESKQQKSDNTRRLSTLMGRMLGNKTPREPAKKVDEVSENERLMQLQKQLFE